MEGEWRPFKLQHCWECKNTVKNRRNLRWLGIPQTPVKDFLLTLVWKARKKEKKWERELVSLTPGPQWKSKKAKTREKYLDFAREQRTQGEMRATGIPFVIGALGTVPKGMKKRAGRVGNRGTFREIQTTILMRSARIVRRVVDMWGDLLSLRLQWKTVS